MQPRIRGSMIPWDSRTRRPWVFLTLGLVMSACTAKIALYQRVSEKERMFAGVTKDLERQRLKLEKEESAGSK